MPKFCLLHNRKKYIAIILLETQNQQSQAKSYEETIISIKANSEQEAEKIAENYGKSCETNYKNGFDEEIYVKFLKVIDVNLHLREDYENSVKELYSRSFENLEF